MGRMASIMLDSPPDLLHFGESARAGSLLRALGGREAFDEALLPEPLARARRDAAVRQAEAAARHRAALEAEDRREAATWRSVLESARDEAAYVAARIEREVGRAARFAVPDVVTAERIGALLGPRDRFVMYEWLDFFGYYAIVADRAGLRHVMLGKGPGIRTAIEAVRVEAGRAVDEEALGRLRRFFLDPLELPEEVERIIVSPMAPMTFLPFALLAPAIDVVHVPSGTTLEWLRRSAGPRGDGVLALGDPKYGGERQEAATAIRGFATRLAPLPATREEARGVGTVVLLSEEATESRLREELAKRNRWRALHLAGHGLIDDRRPALSALALTPAGADDGFLTVADVMSLRVPADLVVLSACESARGPDLEGEGVFGLTSAFLVAGASRIICSLWKVDDEATRALMLRFYELWNPRDGAPGLPASRALRLAQEFVRSQPRWEHPHFWAAWQLWGLPD
jgi:hypothetical protein